MFSFKRNFIPQLQSQLFDEESFYPAFIHDLLQCQSEVIIESPFIARNRMQKLLPTIKKLLMRDIEIHIITKSPQIQEGKLSFQSEEMITALETLGVQVLVASNNHHRKLAILDRNILREGSLNILSQSNSCEVMRRINGSYYADEMFNFLKLGRFI